MVGGTQEAVVVLCSSLFLSKTYVYIAMKRTTNRINQMQAVAEGTPTDAVPAPKRPQVKGWRNWYREQRGRGAFEVGVMFLLIQSGLVLWFLLDGKNLAYLD